MAEKKLCDYYRYKGRLRDYLVIKGAKLLPDGLIAHCFNPAHEDKNPSMRVGPDFFECFACGIKGDIYDAVEIMEGIKDKIEQFDFIQNFLRDDARKKNQITITPRHPLHTKHHVFMPGTEYAATVVIKGNEIEKVYIQDVFGEKVFLNHKDIKEALCG